MRTTRRFSTHIFWPKALLIPVLLVVAACSAAASDFRTLRTFPAGGGVYSVAVADFNGDGKLDVAAATWGQGVFHVAIMFGNGDRTFQSPVSYAVGSEPTQIVAADFNHDGHPDLAVAYMDGLQILINNGDGTFKNPVSYTNVDGYLSSIAVGDFNHDGFVDVAITDRSGNINVLMGNGDGTFGSPVNYPGGGAGYVVAGDFNNDGKLDLATSGTNQVSILLGNGDGTFQAPISTHEKNAGYLAVGDFNRDGKLDLAVSPIFTNTYGPGAVDVFLGNGDGTLQPKTSHRVDSSPQTLLVADFNGDGIPDIAVHTSYGSEVCVMLGIGNGSFRPAICYVGEVGSYGSLAAGDFSGTGLMDIVGASDTASFAMLVDQPGGTFAAGIDYQIGPGGDSTAVGDFNGDGFNDVLQGHSVPQGSGAAASVSVSLNNGKGVFNTTVSTTVPVSAAHSSVVVAAGDFNHDGKLDAAVAYVSSTDLNTYVTILLGNGDGSFTPTGASYLIPLAASLPGDLFAADFNNDGKLDVVTACGIEICLLLGNGDGTLNPAVAINTGTTNNYERTGHFALGDINHDGKMDLLVTNLGFPPSAQYSILLGNGDGTFRTPVVFPDSALIGGVALADLNGDGNLDIAVAESTKVGGSIAVYLGNGDGTFQSRIRSSANNENLFCLAAADFDGDGHMDLMGGTSQYTFSIFHGRGDGTLKFPVTYPMFLVPLYGNSIVVGAFTSSGAPDLTFDTYGDLTIYLNTRD
jgi:FG-GAP-like repeat/FG-GAP repeat